MEKENIDISIDSDLEVYVIPMGDEAKLKSISLVNSLRLSGFNTEMDYNNRNLKSNFKAADKLRAKYIIIVGEEEIKNKVLTIKDNITKEEYKVELENLIEFLDEKLGDVHEN